MKIPAWAGDQTVAAKDFRASLDGAPLRVLSVRGPKDDLMLLVALDLTGDLALVEPAKEALIAEVEKLPARSYAGLLRAQDGLAVVSDPTADRAATSEGIRSLPVSGKAGLLDTVEGAARIGDAILAKAAVRVALLYVTDSDIHNYREDFTNPVINSSDSHDLSRRFPEGLVQDKITKLEGRLAGMQTPLFIVHLAYRGDRLNEAYQNGLKRLSETTGGSSAFCRSMADIPASIHTVLETIQAHYSVSVELPKKTRRALQIHLSLAGGEGNGLHYRPRLTLSEQAFRKE
ncbi:MAG: hypothetical protein HYR60_02770 [Acidobacteria bacterium]|nr:hypothetical protein [Acidobacteriota bacterium]